MTVPIAEASRFGIMNTDEEGRITEFEEKPKIPRSNKASMGIYIFNWSILKKFLAEDAANPDSSNDFGKNVIPAMIDSGCRMFAWDFSGYWKDVGTIASLWEANMDLLGTNPVFNLYDKEWRIYSKVRLCRRIMRARMQSFQTALLPRAALCTALCGIACFMRAFASNPARSWRIQL